MLTSRMATRVPPRGPSGARPAVAARRVARACTVRAAASQPPAAPAGREGESADATRARRLRESARVEERLTYVDTIDQVRDELTKAGDRLVVLEIQSASRCDSGLCEEAEAVWKEDAEAAQRAAAERCASIKHTFARTARDCPNSVFLELDADSDAGAAACEALGATVVPTVQFYKAGALLWSHAGYAAMEQDIGEGVLFYGDAAAGGERASEHVVDVSDPASLSAWLSGIPQQELAVLFVSSSNAEACVHIFPAVLALARNFGGYARFARLVSDASAPASALTASLAVTDVPAFVFYRGGVQVGRHVGSARGDLIGQILERQSAAGVAPPPPPPKRATATVRR